MTVFDVIINVALGSVSSLGLCKPNRSEITTTVDSGRHSQRQQPYKRAYWSHCSPRLAICNVGHHAYLRIKLNDPTTRSFLSCRFGRPVRVVLNSPPIVVIFRGRQMDKILMRHRINAFDLSAALRGAGVWNICEVEACILGTGVPLFGKHLITSADFAALP